MNHQPADRLTRQRGDVFPAELIRSLAGALKKASVRRVNGFYIPTDKEIREFDELKEPPGEVRQPKPIPVANDDNVGKKRKKSRD